MVTICPKCKSKNVVKNQKDFLQDLGGPDDYICTNCGFGGSFFPEVEESELKSVKVDQPEN